MASKGRHLADFLSDDSRGRDLGASQVEIKGNKAKAQAVVRMGQNKNDDLLVANTTSDRIGIQTTNPQAVLDVEGDIFGSRRINAGYLQRQQNIGRKWPWQILYDTISIQT